MIPEDVYSALRKIAAVETDAWRNLEAALQEEDRALQSQDLAEITRSLTQKDMAVSGVRMCAETRRKFVVNAASQWTLSPPVTMESLFQIATPDQRQEMSAWEAKFAAYAASIHTLNQKNMDSIRTALSVVNDSVRFLQNIAEPLPSYTAEGYISAQHLQGRIVSKRG